jgi:dipeptidase E
MVRDLLLLSNGSMHGSGYLDYAEPYIQNMLRSNKKTISKILFIPYARPSGATLETYTTKARDRFKTMGFNLTGIHEYHNIKYAVEDAEAIFIGGGNTFVLLNSLYKADIMEIIKKKVEDGTPYIGASAGSNVAGKTIMTTNDMPIVYPPSFNAMGLIPFIINPHYLDTDPDSTHRGETRETRIKEYHAFNDDIVVGLREGAMLRVIGDNVHLYGKTGAKIFRKGQEPTEHKPGESLDFLLK